MRYDADPGDYANIKALAKTTGVTRYLTTCARQVRAFALANNPPRKSGTYAASIKVIAATPAKPYARVIADDRKAVWLEYGTGQPGPTPAFRTLTKATKAAGFVRIDMVARALKGPAK